MRTYRSLLVSLLFGCSGSQPVEESETDPCLPGGETSLTIGAGDSSYQALSPGEEIPLIYGPQGGYHLEIGLQASNIDASELLTGELTGRIGDEALASTMAWLDFRCNPDTDGLQSWGTLLIYEAQPHELHNQETVIEVEVTDARGTTVSASTHLIIIDSLQD